MIITYLRLSLNFNHPRSAIVSKTHTHGSLPVKKKIVIHKQVVLSTCAWSWQGSPSQLPPAVGQEQKTALFLQHCQLKDTPQGHLQTHHLEYLLPRCSQAELGDGKWLLKKKKQHYVEGSCRIQSISAGLMAQKRQRAEQQEGKATGPL